MMMMIMMPYLLNRTLEPHLFQVDRISMQPKGRQACEGRVGLFPFPPPHICTARHVHQSRLSHRLNTPVACAIALGAALSAI